MSTDTFLPNTLDLIEQNAEQIANLGEHNERLGMLSNESVEILRSTSVMTMLQPEHLGGQETHPAQWAQAVMRIASLDGSAGWLAGIVGVHPWEMAFVDPVAQTEVLKDSALGAQTWIGSPYAPMGVLVPQKDGGYKFSGHWQFSSGTDHCDWLFLGALLADETGVPLMSPPKLIHVLIPSSDYTIVQGTWNTVGLKGTGSKDIVVKDAFVPHYRTIAYDTLAEGTAHKDLGLANPLYHMPFSTIFPLGITSAVIGIAQGALAHHIAYQKTRVTIQGRKVTSDPYSMYALSDAAAQIDASRAALLDGVNRAYDTVTTGGELSFADRAQLRRNQVAAAKRAVSAVDEIVARSGGNGLRMDQPLQRFWRDAHMGLAHAIHVPGLVFHASALCDTGVEPPGYMTPMI